MISGLGSQLRICAKPQLGVNFKKKKILLFLFLIFLLLKRILDKVYTKGGEEVITWKHTVRDNLVETLSDFSRRKKSYKTDFSGADHHFLKIFSSHDIHFFLGSCSGTMGRDLTSLPIPSPFCLLPNCLIRLFVTNS